MPSFLENCYREGGISEDARRYIGAYGDDVITRKDPQIYYQTWGSGRESFLHFYIHSKVIASKEAVASEESGETKVVDRGNAMTKERGYDSGMRVTYCYC
eukprot:scaffold2262_cov188-Skeletonema_marinoi.AAC.6